MGLITAGDGTSVVLGLFSNIISRNINFLTFGFEHTNRFSVYKEEIVSLKIVLKQSLPYSYGSCGRCIMVAVGDLPTCVLKPAVNLDSCFFFRCHVPISLYYRKL